MERSAKQNFILIGGAVMMVGIGWFAGANAQTVGGTLPSIPTGVRVSANSAPGQISVSWGASSESSGTIEGYYIYRNGAQVANTAGTSYVDSGVQPGYYAYTVAAYDANGSQSQQSASASLTLTVDTMPPSVPTGVTVTGATSTNSYYSQIPLTISWSPSTDNVGVVGYRVYRNNISITSSTAILTGTSLMDTVGPGTYSYTVAAYDAAQNISGYSTSTNITIAIDSNPPTVPTGVTAQQISASAVTVSWASSTDASGIGGYQVFRNGMQIASTTASPYTDTGLSSDVQYFYNVTAYDVAGNISEQSEPPVKVTVAPTSGPGIPVIFKTTLLNTSTVQISWSVSSDPLVITSYAVYRDGTAVASPTSTTYLDTGVAPGVHIYNLTATDVSGAVSSSSATSTILVPVPATSTPAVATSTTTIISTTSVPSSTNSVVAAITQFLYYGLRSSDVTALQTILINEGYLAAGKATGFFGSLTASAVQKFQCDQNIVCTGGAGWGTVGPKTRAALNALGIGTTTISSATASATSTAAMFAEIQTLEAALTALEAKIPR